MRIIFDAFGGDNSPNANVEGGIKFLSESDAKLIFVGKKEILEPLIKEECEKYKKDFSGQIEIADASEVVTMEDNPAMIIKKKKDSSMVKALNLIKEKEGDVLVSAGNTRSTSYRSHS